jgi:hypothetical protein
MPPIAPSLMIFRYLDFSAQNRNLIITGVSMAILMLVFSRIPVIGGRLIDLLPYFSYDEITLLLKSYGEKGRHLHILATTTLDVLFPVIYVTFFAGLIHRLKPRPWYPALAPLFLGFTDICENTLIVFMLTQYPNMWSGVVKTASMLTFIKHRMTNLTLLIVLILIIMRIVAGLTKKLTAKSP